MEALRLNGALQLPSLVGDLRSKSSGTPALPPPPWGTPSPRTHRLTRSHLEQALPHSHHAAATAAPLPSASAAPHPPPAAAVARLPARPPFQEGQRLSEVCTWGMGGPAKLFLRVTSEEEMANAISYCHSHSIRWFILGKGSNVLFDDAGFDGAVLLNAIASLAPLGPGRFRAGAGRAFNQLGAEAARDGFGGLEFACGIPGTVGGAVYMNAGADGQETAAAVQEVEIVTVEGERRSLSRARGELEGFGYRTSPFQSMAGFAAIVSATFALEPDPGARARQLALMDRRRRSQPVTERSAGCVFRNPGGISAGALIDQLGLKGTRIGGAGVSEMHANFLLNTDGSSTTSDMRALISTIKARSLEERGIELHEEICYVPYRQ